MSKFFQVLKQVEQERLLRKQQETVPIAIVSEQTGRKPSAFADQAQKSGRPAEFKSPPESIRETFEEVDSHLVSLLSPASFEAEPYQALCHLLGQMHKEKGLAVVAISSPSVGDGKTTTAVNLTGALAQTHSARVLLVDLDLRRPSVSSYLGLAISDHCSLVNAVKDPSLPLEEVVRPCPPFNFATLVNSHAVATPHDVLRSQRLGELLAEVRLSYDYVVVDTPPFIPFSDCQFISRWVDGFLIVVSAHKTPRKLIEATINAVDPDKMVGLVFNSDDRPVFGYASYYTYGPASQKSGGQLKQMIKKVASSLRHRSIV